MPEIVRCVVGMIYLKEWGLLHVRYTPNIFVQLGKERSPVIYELALILVMDQVQLQSFPVLAASAQELLKRQLSLSRCYDTLENLL